MSLSKQYRIWMLSLVPSGRYGRWWIALAILLVGGAVYGIAAILIARNPAYSGTFPWSIPLFFVCAVAYIVPMFHYITVRTHNALDILDPYIESPQRLAELHDMIEKRPLGWVVRTTLVSLGLWILQSRLLAGSWEAMWVSITSGYASVVINLGPLFVWLTMTVAMSALMQNAFTIRRLVPELASDIFEPNSYMPIGSMAVTSTLVALGGMALMSVMWIGGPINWWTTLPALVIFTPLMILLLLLPVLPMHRKLLAQRQEALGAAQHALRASRASAEQDEASLASQAAALSMRREVAELAVWPFDVGTVTRFLSYAVIVPLTWAGAALIEMVVNALLE
ncbi:MAG: hypothetical protein AAF446_05300 [Pseudomonadota bacterium]